MSKGDPGGEAPARSPVSVREGVRDGILAALEREESSRGASAARRLAAAGAAGVAAAVGLTLLFAGETAHHDRDWHLAICGAAWTGLLIESFAFVLLRIRTPRIPLGPAAVLGLIGLALAALVGIFCPDPHYLGWWSSTAVGLLVGAGGGAAWSALCLGLCSASFLGFTACLLLNLRSGRVTHALTPAIALCLLLLPAVALQSAGTSLAVAISWSAGTALGSYLGVAAGLVLSPVSRRLGF